MTRRTPCYSFLLVFIFAVIVVDGHFFIGFQTGEGDDVITDYRVTCSGRLPPNFVRGVCAYILETGHRRCLVKAAFNALRHTSKTCKENPVGSTSLFHLTSSEKGGRILTCAVPPAEMKKYTDDYFNRKRSGRTRDWSCTIKPEDYRYELKSRYCRDELDNKNRVFFTSFNGEDGPKYVHACFGESPSYMTGIEEKKCEKFYTGDETCYIDSNQIPQLTPKDRKYCISNFIVPAELRYWSISFRYDKSGWGGDIDTHLRCNKEPKSLFAELKELHPELRIECKPLGRGLPHQSCDVHILYDDKFLTEDLEKSAGCAYVYKSHFDRYLEMFDD